MTRTSLFNPFALWTDLGLQTAGMMLASAQVIGHRTQQMAQASFPPGARDSAEFALMGHEKMEATMESLSAAGMHMMKLNPMAGAQMLSEMVAIQSDLWSLATSSSLAMATSRNAKLGKSLRRASDSASRFSDHTAHTALKALQPIRSRALANAKRLGKIRK